MRIPAFLIALSLAFPCPAFAAAPKSVAVTVKKTSIRADKQFFAPTIAEAVHKDMLEVVEDSGDWLKISAKGKTGWVHKTAVGLEAAKDKGGFSLFGGNDASKVSQDEIALAGKGFNSQVESEYKKKNPSLDFSAVDRMEKLGSDDAKISAFIKDGKLTPREGSK